MGVRSRSEASAEDRLRRAYPCAYPEEDAYPWAEAEARLRGLRVRLFGCLTYPWPYAKSELTDDDDELPK